MSKGISGTRGPMASWCGQATTAPTATSPIVGRGPSASGAPGPSGAAFVPATIAAVGAASPSGGPAPAAATPTGAGRGSQAREPPGSALSARTFPCRAVGQGAAHAGATRGSDATAPATGATRIFCGLGGGRPAPTARPVSDRGRPRTCKGTAPAPKAPSPLTQVSVAADAAT